jgi:DNA-binding transcriptional ArsR family regulator
MHDDPNVARVASLLADPARAKMVWTLIDGTTRPAGELAYAAGVSAQSASGHLAKLVDGGLLVSEAQGRHRYFRIASDEVAAVTEGMASLGAGLRARQPHARVAPSVPDEFLYARTCYGHLAGEMAVRALESMVKMRWLRKSGRDFAVTEQGASQFRSLGLDVEALREKRRVFARACVDLTQRRPHLGGVLGEALTDAYAGLGWIQRRRRSRVVTITPKGHENFGRLFRD